MVSEELDGAFAASSMVTGAKDSGEASSATGPPPHPPECERIAAVAQLFGISVATIGLCYFARPVVLPLSLAWVAGMALTPPVRWLREQRCPTSVAAALVLAGFLLPLGLTVAHLSHPAMEWIREAPENVLRLKDRFGHLLRPAQRLSQAAASVGTISTGADPKNPAPTVELSDGQVAKAVFTWTGGVLALTGETVALIFLLLSSGDAFLTKLVRTLPTLRDKRRAVEISREIQQSISTYLFSVSLVNIVLGVVLGSALSLAGMPHAAMWGAVAAALNFIPYFGPIVGMAGVGMSGLLAYDTVSGGLVPVAIYLGVHWVEANAVTPMILGRRWMLNPFIIFSMLMFFTWLWGVPGAFLAVPILVSVKVVCDRVPSLRPIAEFIA